MSRSELKLIGTSWCASCKVAGQLLEDKGLEYDYLDGDTDEGMAEAEAVGARGLPILFINKEVYVGNDAVKAIMGLPVA